MDVVPVIGQWGWVIGIPRSPGQVQQRFAIGYIRRCNLGKGVWHLGSEGGLLIVCFGRIGWCIPGARVIKRRGSGNGRDDCAGSQGRQLQALRLRSRGVLENHGLRIRVRVRKCPRMCKMEYNIRPTKRDER